MWILCAVVGLIVGLVLYCIVLCDNIKDDNTAIAAAGAIAIVVALVLQLSYVKYQYHKYVDLEVIEAVTQLEDERVVWANESQHYVNYRRDATQKIDGLVREISTMKANHAETLADMEVVIKRAEMAQEAAEMDLRLFQTKAQ